MAKRKKLPPVHPGEVLREDYLIPAGVTVNALALALRVPVSRHVRHRKLSARNHSGNGSASGPSSGNEPGVLARPAE
jgi:hypothetical protein